MRRAKELFNLEIIKTQDMTGGQDKYSIHSLGTEHTFYILHYTHTYAVALLNGYKLKANKLS